MSAGAAAGAYRACENTARTHYENFPVLSRMLPAHLIPAVAAVYAFARAADDDADEYPPKEGAARLDAKREWIERGHFDGDPIFEALGRTIHDFDLPVKPFLDLISAFRQDTAQPRYSTFGEVLDYCTRSADPVGRIVLMLFGFRDERRFMLSDRICTSLQLINFLQDIRTDLADRGRIYIPAEDMTKFGVSESDLPLVNDSRAPANLRDLVSFEKTRAEKIMREGWPLVRTLPWRLRPAITMFAAGGTTVLRQIRAGSPRPTIHDWSCRIALPMNALRILFGPV